MSSGTFKVLLWRDPSTDTARIWVGLLDSGNTFKWWRWGDFLWSDNVQRAIEVTYFNAANQLRVRVSQGAGSGGTDTRVSVVNNQFNVIATGSQVQDLTGFVPAASVAVGNLLLGRDPAFGSLNGVAFYSLDVPQ